MSRILRLALVVCVVGSMSGCWWRRRRVVIINREFSSQQEIPSTSR